MLFQQELWLIIVGWVTAFIFQRSTGNPAPFGRMALWACVFSLFVGELGMLSTLFFPSDLVGLLVTAFFALLGARFGAKRSATPSKTARTTHPRSNKKQ
ncbi:hypothetical protein [Hydromonas duriensis]|uniref:Uncharacterized protein n=1 Tax=Hydromonas duriensis TaxID=1527608 RepID=A0A4R6Y5W4_9BURK|nr:hypothetical protein [Hydromonas duriensis]TDR29013.1 hypothetical protein DFR44_1284 [Hydromonas duriensis]